MVWDFDLVWRIGLIAIVFNYGPIVLFFILRPLVKHTITIARPMYRAEMNRHAKNRREGKGLFHRDDDDGSIVCGICDTPSLVDRQATLDLGWVLFKIDKHYTWRCCICDDRLPPSVKPKNE